MYERDSVRVHVRARMYMFIYEKRVCVCTRACLHMQNKYTQNSTDIYLARSKHSINGS